jgi:hypothetical protein
MNKKMEVQFECWKCKSNKMAYQKYAKCLTPVRLTNDGDLLYYDTFVEEDDYLAVLYGFCCEDCGSLIEYSGCRIETEKQLQCYLGIPSENLDKEQGASASETSSESDQYVNENQQELFDLMDRIEKDGVYLNKEDE